MTKDRPRYLVIKPNRDGTHRHYWQPDALLRRAGWKSARLSGDYALACAEAVERNQAVARWRTGDRVTPKNENPRKGLLYFIQGYLPGAPVKIGYSRDGKSLAGRLQNLNTGSPAPLRVIAKARGSRRHELLLHTLFAAERLQGEWFHPSTRLLNFAQAVDRHGLAGALERLPGVPGDDSP